MSEVIDKVMKQVIKGCRAEARKELTEDWARIRKANTRLKRENLKLKRELADVRATCKELEGPMLAREKACARREKEIRLAATKVIMSANEIDKVKRMRVGSFISPGMTGWTAKARRARALTSLKNFMSNK